MFGIIFRAAHLAQWYTHNSCMVVAHMLYPCNLNSYTYTFSLCYYTTQYNKVKHRAVINQEPLPLSAHLPLQRLCIKNGYFMDGCYTARVAQIAKHASLDAGASLW